MKVAIVIAFKNFKDEEYFRTREVIEEAGHEIETISIQNGFALGVDGGQIKVDKLIGELNISSCDGLIFIGGPGALGQLDNEGSYNLIGQSLKRSNFVLGAICIAPIIFAHADCFAGYKMTVWSEPLQKWSIKELENARIIYSNDSVVCDKQVITANGPAAAVVFAKQIVVELDKLSR
jgi:putative intracellular protease/amidase